MKSLFQGLSPLMLFVALTLASYWIVQNNQPVVRDDTQLQPPLLVVHDAISYSYNQQGNTNTALATPLVTYYTDARGTIFTNPNLTHMENGITTTLSADTAIENRAHTEIILTGNVVGVRKNPSAPSTDSQISTDQITYYPNENKVENNTSLMITTPNSITHAIGAIWHLNQNLFILKKNVRSNYATSH